MSRVLVAYFSATGNTAKVAKELAELEDAEIFEIKPVEPYTKEDLDYNEKKSRSNMEMADTSCRPSYVGKVEDMPKYHTVFLGFPIWWGREPSIIDTFLEDYSFIGKKIIPFCTSGMSDVDQASAHMRQVVVDDGVVIDPGRRLGAEGSEEEVKLWTKLLGVKG